MFTLRVRRLTTSKGTSEVSMAPVLYSAEMQRFKELLTCIFHQICEELLQQKGGMLVPFACFLALKWKRDRLIGSE